MGPLAAIRMFVVSEVASRWIGRASLVIGILLIVLGTLGVLKFGLPSRVPLKSGLARLFLWIDHGVGL